MYTVISFQYRMILNKIAFVIRKKDLTGR